jgi:hypothetical protein
MSAPRNTKRALDPPLWIVQQRELWGDYGDVLISGYARRTVDGVLSLHRTGPFLPPISFPWTHAKRDVDSAVVVSAELKASLEALNLPGVRFRTARRSRIVPLSWETWDLRAREPAEYPDENEPENYLLNRKHDPRCAARMSTAFELILPDTTVGIDSVEDPANPLRTLYTSARSGKGALPASRTHPTCGDLVVDDRMRTWLKKHVGNWVRFEPVTQARTRRQRT